MKFKFIRISAFDKNDIIDEASPLYVKEYSVHTFMIEGIYSDSPYEMSKSVIAYWMATHIKEATLLELSFKVELFLGNSKRPVFTHRTYRQ